MQKKKKKKITSGRRCSKTRENRPQLSQQLRCTTVAAFPRPLPSAGQAGATWGGRPRDPPLGDSSAAAINPRQSFGGAQALSAGPTWALAASLQGSSGSIPAHGPAGPLHGGGPGWMARSVEEGAGPEGADTPFFPQPPGDVKNIPALIYCVCVGVLQNAFISF